MTKQIFWVSPLVILIISFVIGSTEFVIGLLQNSNFHTGIGILFLFSFVVSFSIFLVNYIGGEDD